MNKKFNDGLTHDSGMEFNAQAASNKPVYINTVSGWFNNRLNVK